MKKENKFAIAATLIIIVAFMSVGITLFSTRIDRNTITTSINSTYRDVSITSITSVETIGSAQDIKSVISGKSSITVSPSINEKGDKVIYTINVKNVGNQNSQLKSIKVEPELAEYLTYSLENINAGDVLEKGDSKMFDFVLSFNDEYFEESVYGDIPEITLTLEYEK